MARILVVDDESDMRMALGNVLSRGGHKVFEAGDGPTALDFLEAEGADLVLLDMRLPGMDGVQILKKLRERDTETPVVMVTGYGSLESAVEVMQLGASHYLAKPFSNQELVTTVERVLRGEQAADPVGVLGKRLEDKVRGAAATTAPVPRRESTPPAVVARREAPTSGAAWAVFGALAAAVLGSALFVAQRAPQAVRDYPVAQKNPTALVWMNGELWTADWVTQTVNQYKLAGDKLEAVRSVALPDVHVTGLAVSKDRLWICDPWKGVIQERKLEDGFPLVASYKSPGPKPSGLFFDGRYLWSSDAKKRRFYRHGVDAELAVLESFPAPGRSPASVFKDKNFFWSADSETRLIYKHRLDRSLRPIEALSAPGLDAGAAPLSAFAMRGPDAWIGRDGSGALTRVPLAAFEVRKMRQEP
jgi:CheY-like chemotaxis protein